MQLGARIRKTGTSKLPSQFSQMKYSRSILSYSRLKTQHDVSMLLDDVLTDNSTYFWRGWITRMSRWLCPLVTFHKQQA